MTDVTDLRLFSQQNLRMTDVLLEYFKENSHVLQEATVAC